MAGKDALVFHLGPRHAATFGSTLMIVPPPPCSAHECLAPPPPSCLAPPPPSQVCGEIVDLARPVLHDPYGVNAVRETPELSFRGRWTSTATIGTISAGSHAARISSISTGVDHESNSSSTSTRSVWKRNGGSSASGSTRRDYGSRISCGRWCGEEPRRVLS